MTYTVDEGGTSEITVNVTPAADRRVTVTVTMTGSGATLSGLIDGMLTLERGQMSPPTSPYPATRTTTTPQTMR